MNLLKILKILTQWIIPSLCPICSKEVQGNFLCSKCWYDVDFIDPISSCDRCGITLQKIPFQEFQEFTGPSAFDMQSQKKDSSDAICEICNIANNTMEKQYLDRNFSIFIYNKIGKKICLQIKNSNFHQFIPIVEIFAKHMISKSVQLHQADIIIPIPLHWTRFLARNYNQANVIGKIIAKLLNQNPSNNILKRHKKTKSQGKMTIDQRRENLLNAFSLTRNGVEAVKNKTIILIDDVMTSGATLEEAARILKENGAVKVYSVTLAKTLLPLGKIVLQKDIDR